MLAIGTPLSSYNWCVAYNGYRLESTLCSSRICSCNRYVRITGINYIGDVATVSQYVENVLISGINSMK